MSKETKGYPNPDAKHPISGRLERVRTEFGIKSKRAFHRRLSDGWEDAVSYEAVRNYHYDREPPPSYLARVAEVFDVRLAWLVAGKGAMTEDEERMENDLSGEGGEPNPYDLLLEEIPELEELDASVRAALVTYMHRWVRAHLRTDYQVTLEEALEHTLSAWRWIHEPLVKWQERVGRQVPMDRSGASDYIMAALHALNMSLQVAAPPGMSYEDLQEMPPLGDADQ